MATAVPVPKHFLSESPNSRTINVSNWKITATTNPISNASSCDALQASLGFPLPEMTFGENSLELVFGGNEETGEGGWKYMWTTDAALRGVKNGELVDGDGGVKVGYADKWLQSR